MISNQILQNTIDGVKGITKIDLSVVDADGNLTWIWADQTVLGLCNLEFYKKAEMTDINKNIYHLYLGYNFKKVKVGTQYVVKQEDGKDDVYVVDGILKKHQN